MTHGDTPTYITVKHSMFCHLIFSFHFELRVKYSTRNVLYRYLTIFLYVFGRTPSWSNKRRVRTINQLGHTNLRKVGWSFNYPFLFPHCGQYILHKLMSHKQNTQENGKKFRDYNKQKISFEHRKARRHCPWCRYSVNFKVTLSWLAILLPPLTAFGNYI